MVKLIKVFLTTVVERFATPLATFECSSPKLQLALSLGLDDVLLYQAEEFDRQFVGIAIIAGAKPVAQA